MLSLGWELTGLWAILAMMVAVWLGSVVLKDASIVDRFWGIGFVLLAHLYLIPAGGWSGAGWSARLLVVLVTVWGVRLALYITWRNWGKGEDFRYRAMRAGHRHFGVRSLFTVFLLQGVLAWIIAMPLPAALALSASRPNPFWLGLGLVLWLTGFLFESVGDWQLARFKSDPVNRGRVMDRGLWRYTRHPNYFGDALVWWGYFCFAAAVGGFWSAIGPIVMTVLLMRVSGVALLEKVLLETKPQYRDYVQRTSAFFPRWPRST